MDPRLKNLLKSLEKYSKDFWNINKNTGAFLNLLIKDRNIKIALEIGTSNGYSGIWLAEALSHTNGHLYTIESHKDRHLLAWKNFKKSKLNNFISPILGHAPETIPIYPKYFDLAFFDATKYEHVNYFHALKNRIKKGGLIITDNINSHKKDLLPYIKTVSRSKNWLSIKLDIGTGLLISLKINQ